MDRRRTHESGFLIPSEVVMIVKGEKIKAIKSVREDTGMSLKECKAMIDKFVDRRKENKELIFYEAARGLYESLVEMVEIFWGDTKKEEDRESFRWSFPEHSVVKAEKLIAEVKGKVK